MRWIPPQSIQKAKKIKNSPSPDVYGMSGPSWCDSAARTSARRPSNTYFRQRFMARGQNVWWLPLGDDGVWNNRFDRYPQHVFVFSVPVVYVGWIWSKTCCGSHVLGTSFACEATGPMGRSLHDTGDDLEVARWLENQPSRRFYALDLPYRYMWWCQSSLSWKKT